MLPIPQNLPSWQNANREQTFKWRISRYTTFKHSNCVASLKLFFFKPKIYHFRKQLWQFKAKKIVRTSEALIWFFSPRKQHPVTFDWIMSIGTRPNAGRFQMNQECQIFSISHSIISLHNKLKPLSFHSRCRSHSSRTVKTNSLFIFSDDTR